MSLQLNVITVDELHHDKWLKELIKIDEDFTEDEAKKLVAKILKKHDKAPMSKEDMVQAVSRLFAGETESQHILGNRSCTSEFEYEFTQISTHGFILSVAIELS